MQLITFSKKQWTNAAKDISWLTIATILTGLLTVVSALAFANIISPEVYGIYSFVSSIGAILTITSLTGFFAVTKSAIARKNDGVFKPAIRLRTVGSFAGSIIGLLIAIYYESKGNSSLAIMFAIVSFSLPIVEPKTLYSAILLGKKKYRTEALFRVSTRLFVVITGVTTLVLTKDILITLLVTTLVRTLSISYFYATSIKNIENEKKERYFKKTGIHLSLMNSITVIVNHYDKILLFQVLGPTQVAGYIFATMVPDQFKAFVKNINDFLLPRIAEHRGVQLHKIIFTVMLYTALLLIPVLAIYWLLAEHIFQIALPQYIDVILYSKIYSLSLFTTIATAPLSALQSQFAYKELYISKIGYSAFGFASMTIGVLYGGILGAIFARLLTKLVNLLLLTFLFYRKT